jgi:hypothetical protein
MVCTKQVYNAVATWAPSDVANLFRDAFIDAGLMTAWHDSFLSGSTENRILEVVYDGTKAYGKTYYWFMFTTNGVFLQLATGWNTSTDQPTGTQYLDFLATTTNSPANHWTLFSGVSTVTLTLTRYTSGVDADQSWFVITSSTIRRCFTIASKNSTIQPWMDLTKGFYSGFAYSIFVPNGTMGNARWGMGPCLRRELVRGPGLVGATTITNYNDSIADESLLGYAAAGHQSNSMSSNININQPYIFLPVGFSSSNPAYTTNSSPIFHSLPYSPYIAETLPSDIGITFHYATNNFSTGDTLIVTPGAEEWEVLDYGANSSSITGASPLFLARMV